MLTNKLTFYPLAHLPCHKNLQSGFHNHLQAVQELLFTLLQKFNLRISLPPLTVILQDPKLGSFSTASTFTSQFLTRLDTFAVHQHYFDHLLESITPHFPPAWEICCILHPEITSNGWCVLITFSILHTHNAPTRIPAGRLKPNNCCRHHTTYEIVRRESKSHCISSAQ